MTDKANNVDEYIAGFPADTRKVLEEVRKIILDNIPSDAVELISYAIPAYKLVKKPIVYFSGYEKHYSLYPRPVNPEPEFEKELEPHVAGKGTLRFALDKPVPKGLIKRIVESRLNTVK